MLSYPRVIGTTADYSDLVYKSFELNFGMWKYEEHVDQQGEIPVGEGKNDREVSIFPVIEDSKPTVSNLKLSS